MSLARLLILFGGRSSEHEVSVRSARNVARAVDRKRYQLIMVGIDQQGSWRLQDTDQFINAESRKDEVVSPAGEELTLILRQGKPALFSLVKNALITHVDLAFPVLHGTYGEDGTMQGLLKLCNLPFVGPGVLGSSVSMDKDVTKCLLRDAGIPVARSVTLRKEQTWPDYQALTPKLGQVLFVKPCNAGSSVGVSKVTNQAQFQSALEKAFLYDTKVLIEEGIKGRELECSVLGNENPSCSLPGEVIAHHDFYSYEAKYLDDNGATLEIPAKLPSDAIKLLQERAIATYKALNLEGMTRVDFFLTEQGEALVNEVNTIPGFTNISMYPKLWEATGISYQALIDQLLELAVKRHEREQALSTVR